jgi:hypothetical protein
MLSGTADFRVFERAKAVAWAMGFGRSAAAFRPESNRLRRLAVAALLGLAPLAPLHAQTTIYAAGQGSPNSVALPINVMASVGGRCGFAAASAPSGTVSAPDFDVNGINQQVQFKLNCTGASRVAVLSTNGGLLNTGATDPGYTGLAPYSVKLTLVPNSGSPVVATCPVDTLKTGSATTCAPTNFRGTADQTTGLRLGSPSTTPTSMLEVIAPVYSGANTLIAGTYNDTLTVTVSPST